jgi:hypothetical protein
LKFKVKEVRPSGRTVRMECNRPLGPEASVAKAPDLLNNQCNKGILNLSGSLVSGFRGGDFVQFPLVARAGAG